MVKWKLNFLSLVLVIFLLGAYLVTPTLAHGYGRIVVNLPREGEVGSTVTVTLSVSNFANFNVESISGFQMDLVYDETIMVPVTREGAFHTSASMLSGFSVSSTNYGNSIRVVGTSTDARIDGNGQLLSFTFEIVGEGQGTVSLRNVSLEGVSNAKVAHTGGTINSFTAPEPITPVNPNHNPEPSSIEPTSISLNKKSIKLTQGETERLTTTVTPANAENKSVEWSSNNSGVATVDQRGNVRAIAPGSAIITAKTKAGNISATTIVEVLAKEVQGVTIHGNTTITVEATEYLRAVFRPVSTSNPSVQWASSNPKVATIDDDGKVTGISEGQSIITVTTEDGAHSAGVTLNVVSGLTLTNLRVTENNISMTVGDTRRPNLIYTPSQGVNREVKWVSSDNNIVSVDDSGTFRALAEGEAVMTGTSVSGNHQVRVTVIVNPLPREQLHGTKHFLENDQETFFFPRTIYFEEDYIQIWDNNVSITLYKDMLEETFEANAIHEYDSFEIYVERKQANIPIENFSYVSDIYQFKLKIDGRYISNFSGDIVKEFRFDQRKVGNYGAISLYHYNEEIQEWERAWRNEVDFETGKVKTYINHWSEFALLEDLILSEALSAATMTESRFSLRCVVLVMGALACIIFLCLTLKTKKRSF